MKLSTDTRGVSEVIGAILVFGLLVALLAIFQTQAIPAANQEVEFDHNQEVQADMVKFHEKASQVALGGERQSIGFKAGTTYPNRLLFFNPSSATGELATSGEGSVSIENVNATDDQINKYIDGSLSEDLTSRSLRYSPMYNYYDNSPDTVYEHGVLYNQFDEDEYLIKNSGGVVDGTDIDLLFVAGEYSDQSSDTLSLDLRPVSAPARPVTIEADENDPIDITLPTDLPQEAWEELLEDEEHVVDNSIDVDEGEVTFQLDEGQTYTLKMSLIGTERQIDRPEAEYIVPVGGDSLDILEGGQGTVEFEVRDKYNNPVSGERVELQDESGAIIADGQTDSDGRISESIAVSNDATITGNATECTTDACAAEVDINLVSTSGINPSENLRLMDAVVDEDLEILGIPFVPGDIDGAKVTFETAGDTLTPSQMRVSHFQESDGGSPTDINASVANDDGEDGIEMEVRGGFADVSDLDSVEDEEDYFFVFEDTEVSEGDFFVIELIYEDEEGEETRSTYFISPRDE